MKIAGLPLKKLNYLTRQPRPPLKEQGKGTGLGLAIAYSIIKKHSGDIKVYSEMGKGTTFSIYLPRMEKSVKRTKQSATEQQHTGSEKILLVDDEESIAKLQKRILENLGYSVTMHVNSREALESFKARPNYFDLVISDMTMPNMTGNQLAIELKMIRSNIPVIICTGFSETIDQENFKKMGIEKLLMKPVSKSNLTRTVREILDDAKRNNKSL